MPLTNAQKSMNYRNKKIKEIGLEAYRKMEAEKRRLRRAKKKASALAPPASSVHPPAVPSVPVNKTKELKLLVKRLNEYLNKESKIDVPTIIQFVQKNLITGVIDIKNSKNCDLLYSAVFIAKNKFLEKGITEASHKQQTANIGRLYKYMTKEPFKCTPDQFAIFKDTLRVINAIETNPKWKKANTINQYKQDLASILKYLHGYEDAYNVYSKASTLGRKEITLVQDDLKLTDKERKNFVRWSELKKTSKSNKLNTYEKALIGLYTLLPPRRRELSQLLTLTDREHKLKKNLNYLILDKKNNPKKIIMNKYKTFKSYGPYEIKLPKQLKMLLRNHIEENGIQVGKPVFHIKDKNKYHQGSNMSSKIQTILKKSTDKRISFNILRHSKIQDFLSTPKSINRKKTLAKKMGHDIMTQARYDRIFKEEELD